LQKFLNITFVSSNRCAAEHRGTRDLLIIIALRLSIYVWLFGAAHFVFEGTTSILDCWKKDYCLNKYDRLCPAIPRLQGRIPARVNPKVGR
jgi:hypothetical protein